MYFANAEELLKKIGLKSSVIKSGKYIGHGFASERQWPMRRNKILQGLIDDIYDQFLNVIEQDRKIARVDILRIADGRVFQAGRQRAWKLVDVIGDRTTAVSLQPHCPELKVFRKSYTRRRGTSPFGNICFRVLRPLSQEFIKIKLSQHPEALIFSMNTAIEVNRNSLQTYYDKKMIWLARFKSPYLTTHQKTWPALLI